MFLSNKHSYIIPQQEHAKIAAMIASLWGNDRFEKVSFEKEFVNGVLIHDRGFGMYDNNVQRLSKEERLLIFEKGIKEDSGNVISDVVVLLHVKRLMEKYSEELVGELTKLCSEKIEEKILLSGVTKEEFLFADRITKIADSIAFDFSSEEDSEDEALVFAKHKSGELVKIKFFVKGNVINMNPWPLSVDFFEGKISTYVKEGYPSILQPEERVFILKR